MNITLKNFDPQSTEHTGMVVEWLNAISAIHRVSPRVLNGMTDTFIDLKEMDPADPLAIEDRGNITLYGKTTRAFLEHMMARIKAQGSTTLEEVATDMGITLDTARAYLRNAGRTASAHKVSLPVAPKWNHEKGRNDYVWS